jgi:SHS2 domain-containing protein
VPDVHRWADHTSELELHIEAPTEEGVFVDALAAFAELVGDGASSSSAEREIVVAGEERDVLLADWLNELVFLADRDGFLPERVIELELSPSGLRASVKGRDGDPAPLVKAASLHGLRYERASDGAWRARVVLDV